MTTQTPDTAPLPRGVPFQRPCRADPRFSYGLYLPQVPDDAAAEAPLGLVVAVHDSRRLPMECITGFMPFCDAHRHAVLAPLFPRDVQGIGCEDGYKFLHEPGLRYDQLLHTMMEELAGDLPCDGERFFLHGYSGGAQFAHRYLLLHPGRVRAATVGAPGGVTLIDDQADWWAGVRNMEALFGRALDLAALRRVPLQLLVGEHDTETDEMKEQPPSRFWHSDAERLGANRIDRLQVLRRSLEAIGAKPRFHIMPGLKHGHGPGPAMARAAAFFAEHLCEAPQADARAGKPVSA
jgi:pimeloyl-ACP methyl ester carboxylesterase